MDSKKVSVRTASHRLTRLKTDLMAFVPASTFNLMHKGKFHGTFDCFHRHTRKKHIKFGKKKSIGISGLIIIIESRIQLSTNLILKKIAALNHT
jgi:hypothetical protein